MGRTGGAVGLLVSLLQLVQLAAHVQGFYDPHCDGKQAGLNFNFMFSYQKALK